MNYGIDSYQIDRKILYSFYFVCFLNLPFWGKILDIVSFDKLSDVLFFASIAVILTSTFYVLFSLVLYRYFEKIMVMFLAVLSVFASYSIYNFKILIDVDMIRNVLHTDLQESIDLISPALAGWLLGFGIIPLSLIFIFSRKGVNRTFLLGFKSRLTRVFIALLVITSAAALSYKSAIVIFRNHRDIIKTVTPLNIFYYIGKYYSQSLQVNSPSKLQEVGLDAHKGNLWPAVTKKTVLVLVVGEAARSAHFSLNGYARETNPLLKQKSVVSLKNVSSCGTSTAVSLPGMFSRYPRHDYSVAKAKAEENLLDVLVRVNFEISWFDNNSDSKGVAIRLNETRLRGQNQTDEILLDKLAEKLNSLDGDAIIVLHQLGSHGPSYYKRYPETFNHFSPGCETNEIQKCSVTDLINTYDNTILYTDYILAKVVDMLEQREDINGAMIYVADHGESLGEKGVYLHGAPYMIAPHEQIHVPWIMWLSDQFVQSFQVDKKSLELKADTEQFSHDNLFHSVLGLLNIETKEYNPELDIFLSKNKGSLDAKTTL